MTTSFLSDKFLKLMILATLFFLCSFITYERVQICQLFGVAPLAAMPLSGYLHGWSPPLFARLMHNLTHPLFLLVYTLAATVLAVGPLRRLPSANPPSPWPFSCLACLFLICTVGYFISILLPIRTVAATLSAH